MTFIIICTIIGIVFVYKAIDAQANIDEEHSDW
jgi:hypothetical protein